MAVLEKDLQAQANPTKSFFVSMITRDISLEDSILDLIDNSVDSAWRSEGSLPMALGDGTDLSQYHISINTSPEGFSITDNCGGMTLDDAVEHAFSFGRRETEAVFNYSIGVYGIGMKRAVFKLGKTIRIISTYKEDDGNVQSFGVPIVVDEWLQNDEPPWDFDIEGEENLEERGVEISVSNLTSATKSAFENPAFVNSLRRTIARDYSIHLNRGLQIQINDRLVKGLPIELSRGVEFEPVRIDYKDSSNGEAVSVEIIGGMAAPPPDSSEPDDSEDGENRYGWYLACNGRIVLAADKTILTGWGSNGWPLWHPQYAGFIGVVLFTAADAAALPLTTTKRSVDISSEVYKRAKLRMRDITKEWTAYTNIRKNAIEEAKQKEVVEAVIPIHEVVRKPSIKLPKLTADQTKRRANVNYSVAMPKMKKLAEHLGNVNMSYKDVGLKSFEYTYDDIVGEE